MTREAFIWNPRNLDDALASVSFERDGSIIEFGVQIYLHRVHRIPQAWLTFTRTGTVSFSMSLLGKLP